MSRQAKPKLGVFKFASCDGCQLSLLNLEEDLLSIAAEVEISYFPEASSSCDKGPYEIALVEGSITTQSDAARIQKIRRDSKYLVALGACSMTGGIQALRNWSEIKDYVREVYPSPEFIQTLADSSPLASHVAVDFAISGCPINRKQLLEVIVALCIGRPFSVPEYSLCLECKRRGNVCVLVAEGVPCLGPITQAGCGAICPSYSRGCYGCFGPMESANPDVLIAGLESRGIERSRLQRLLRGFTANAEVFRAAGDKWEATR